MSIVFFKDWRGKVFFSSSILDFLIVGVKLVEISYGKTDYYQFNTNYPMRHWKYWRKEQGASSLDVQNVESPGYLHWLVGCIGNTYINWLERYKLMMKRVRTHLIWMKIFSHKLVWGWNVLLVKFADASTSDMFNKVLK